MEATFFSFPLFLIISINIALTSSTPFSNSTTDEHALLAFKSSITDPFGVLTKNWSSKTSICDWIGVTCGRKHKRVIALNVSGFGLAGTIPPHLGNLTFLRSFDISSNNFTGLLPSALSKLRRLGKLNVGVNGFTGEIPSWFGTLTELTRLHLNNNTFAGAIPPSLFNASRLQILNMGDNFLGGNVREEIGNLSCLETLILAGNQLTGSIPDALFNISSLMVIGLGRNSLSGKLPSHTCSSSSKLRRIGLSLNLLHGEIPHDICKCRDLEILSLSYNHFSGSIPAQIGCFSMLRLLYLGVNDFQGEIPSEIGNLSRLERLSIPDSSLTGHIPKSIFNISSLNYIDLSNNSLSGNIPSNSFHNLPPLEKLYLYRNKLTGNIPEEIGYLSSLTILQLNQNNLIGFIPKQVGNLTSLTYLNVHDNNLKGELPEELANLAYLKYFSVVNNSLSGSIPSFLFNISTLRILGLSQNQFSGNLPSNIGKFSLLNLEELYLHHNRLNGEIPSYITNASRLTTLSLESNSFSGSIPDFGNLRLLNWLSISENNLSSPTQELRFLSSLVDCQYLELLDISSNPLHGVLPTSFTNLSASLLTLAAEDCHIIGAIPSELGNLSSLLDIFLDGNQLTGRIPATIGNLKQLQRLYLYDNQLNGYIPNDLCQMIHLGEMDLSGNMLVGPIPECLSQLTALKIIYLDSNRLNSTLPSNFWINLVDIVGLSMSSNYLSGQVSSQIENLKAINYMDLSSNLFSGAIPTTIDGCQSLEILNMSNNEFIGFIPESLGKVRGLKTLDLSNNNLSGMIPKSLEDLPFLEYLNVSHNILQGEIPNEGGFVNFTAQSFLHNPALCGATRFQVPPCTNHPRSRSKSTVASVIKYVVPPFISTIVLAIIIVVCIRRRNPVKVPLPVDTSVSVAWRVVSYNELKRGTSSFSEMNLLGRGSFGSVFKGTLSDGMNVAVKVFNLELEGADRSFGSESRILSSIRHRNLVRIIGCCTNMEFKALILEFMQSGSLEKWLYSDNFCLDLEQRLSIAIDVALALEYLHHGHTFPIVHCDIKPSNVLLDEDMIARVCDFGISKLFNQGEAITRTKTLATIGYAAPEYGSEGMVSTSGDVYSYGVVLMEMFTSKKPTDDMFSGETSLKGWVSEALEADAIDEVVASGLLSREDRNFIAKERCLSSIFDLAMKCSVISRDERINMIQVAATLQKIKATVVTTNTRRQQ
ncbi:hypothetical protein C2S51_016474 [Perilla frutescens var. frutescens]|nr:hypothetical protein C2S51_016474 [Perilla frutescens var. frutescens]